jgi:hypothetical protein
LLSAITVEEKPMRTMLAALGLAAGLGVIACQSAVAMPINAGAVQQAAAATTVQPAQYSERRHHGKITKCYREFVVGTYACRTYRAW